MILSLRWTILFSERKFYDANIVLDSFQNRVLKTHLNFTSLSSESRVPSFYAFASTQLPYLIFHSFKIQWKRSTYVFLFLFLPPQLKNKMLQRKCQSLYLLKYNFLDLTYILPIFRIIFQIRATWKKLEIFIFMFQT